MINAPQVSAVRRYSFYDDTEFTIACSEPNFDKEGFERFTAYLSSIVPDHIPKLYRK